MSDRLRVILKRGRSKPFWLGHPWVFSGAIHEVIGDVGDTGGPCVVEDERKNVVGAGFYNPSSRVAVRIMQHRRTTDLPFEPRPLEEVIEERVESAVRRRAALGLPADDTTVYRVVNAEGDLLPGLVVDRLGPVAFVDVHSRQMYEVRARLAAQIARLAHAERVVVAVREEASRFEAIPVIVETYPESSALSAKDKVRALENGVIYELDVTGGQKTGFFADQRDNRASFAARCGGKSVLDLFCYVGGFGLSAARAGASSVIAVDSSGPAVSAASRNAELNRVADRFEAMEADVSNFLKANVGAGRTWERIICDPPKLIRSRAHLEDAIKKYARLNTLAMSALAPGGLMLTCSCSRHLSEDELLRILTEAGHRLRRTVQVHALTGQAPDHPFPSVAHEGRYLKAALIGLE